MTKNYSLEKHEKNFIKGELYHYQDNIRKLRELQDDIINAGTPNDGQPRGNATSDQVAMKVEKLITSKSILIVTEKIQKISNALSKLSTEDKQIVEIIFFKGHNQVYAQMHDNISKDMYYGAMNRIIKLVAIEYEMIEGK